MFLTSRDTTRTKLSLLGLSWPFRDGWKLCIVFIDFIPKFKKNHICEFFSLLVLMIIEMVI